MTAFLTNKFFISLVLISALMVLLFLFKKVFQKHLSCSFRYYFGYLFLLVLILPFIPYQYQGFDWLQMLFSHTVKNNSFISLQEGLSLPMVEKSNGIYDFAVSMPNLMLQKIRIFCFFLWIVGVFFMIAFITYGAIKLRKLKKNRILVETDTITILEKGKQKLGIKRKIDIGKSSEVKSPLIFGVIRPTIILPLEIEKMISPKEMQYILLHELTHYKNRDILMNYIGCIFRTIYWFHPLVWYGFRQMQIDREIFCDRLVLKKIEPDAYKEYGMTIIHFIENMKGFSFRLAADMGGSKKQIKKRLQEIAAFSGESLILKWKSYFIFIFLFIIILSQAPFISVVAQETYQYNKENVAYEDFSSYFQGYQGSFVLYDLKQEKYSVYNEEQSKKRVSPNSTFKIYSALFALKNKIITTEDSERTWDKTPYFFEQWNQNQNLNTAMQYSVNWYFEQLNQEIGFDILKKEIQEIQYGNCDLSGGEDRFWLESSLKISPYEQVSLLKKFYLNELPFQTKDKEVVQSAMKISEKANGEKLFGKTGSGIDENQNKNGWFLGFVEQEDNTYLFAVYIQGMEEASGITASEIALKILDEKGIY